MPPQPQTPQQPQLKNTTIALMVSVALLYDGLQALLNFILMGWIVSPIAFLTFYLWFKLRGIKFATAKRSGVMGVGFILELIPLLNTLPAWTLSVILVIMDIKMKPPKPADNSQSLDKAA